MQPLVMYGVHWQHTLFWKLQRDHAILWPAQPAACLMSLSITHVSQLGLMTRRRSSARCRPVDCVNVNVCVSAIFRIESIRDSFLVSVETNDNCSICENVLSIDRECLIYRGRWRNFLTLKFGCAPTLVFPEKWMTDASRCRRTSTMRTIWKKTADSIWEYKPVPRGYIANQWEDANQWDDGDLCFLVYVKSKG